MTIMYERTEKAKFKVPVIESERGWGQKVDYYAYFETIQSANQFIKEYNSQNNLPYVPDWYMYAGEAQPI